MIVCGSLIFNHRKVLAFYPLEILVGHLALIELVFGDKFSLLDWAGPEFRHYSCLLPNAGLQ